VFPAISGGDRGERERENFGGDREERETRKERGRDQAKALYKYKYTTTAPPSSHLQTSAAILTLAASFPLSPSTCLGLQQKIELGLDVSFVKESEPFRRNGELHSFIPNAR
jgi:hypothetical protein